MENKNYKPSYYKCPYNIGQHVRYTIKQETIVHDYECTIYYCEDRPREGVYLLMLKKDSDGFLFNILVDSEGKPIMQSETVTRTIEIID
jgi:hypothetical protein